MRVTIDRTVFGKLNTQLAKPHNTTVKALLLETKVTYSPTHDAILWDPKPELLSGVVALLKHEQGFMRKKEGCSYKLMTTVIARLEKLIPPTTRTE